MSGLTWEVLKMGLTQYLNNNQDYKVMSSRKSKKVRENESDKFMINKEKLILVDFQVHDSQTEMVFNAYKYYIY